MGRLDSLLANVVPGNPTHHLAKKRGTVEDSDQDSDSHGQGQNKRRRPSGTVLTSDQSDDEDASDVDCFNNLVAGSLNEILKGQSQDVEANDTGPSSSELMGLEDPLSESVPVQIRKKIVKNKYVDLKTLLCNNQAKEVNIRVKDTKGNSEVSLCQPNYKTDQNLRSVRRYM